MVQAGGEDLELETRDAFTFLAKQMQKEAGKSQAPLKQDVLKVCSSSIQHYLNRCTFPEQNMPWVY